MTKKQLQLLYLIFAVSVLGTLGSLYFSEIKHLPPCTLCWYQRIALYPIMLISAVAVLREDKKAHFYMYPFAVIGLAVAAYQNLLIYGILPETIQTCTGGVSCTQETITWLGFITIPLLSLGAFAVITVATWMFAKKDTKKRRSQSRSNKHCTRRVKSVKTPKPNKNPFTFCI